MVQLENLGTLMEGWEAELRKEHASRVLRVYIAVSLRSNGAYLLSPWDFKAAVSTCRTIPTCNHPEASVSE